MSVWVQVDIGCDLALVEVNDANGRRRYRIEDLFSPLDIRGLGEEEPILEQIAGRLIEDVPGCRIQWRRGQNLDKSRGNGVLDG